MNIACLKRGSSGLLALSLSLVLSGCLTNPAKQDEPAANESKPAAKSADSGKSSTAKSAEPSKSSSAKADKKEVKGINGWTGSIEGKPAPKSKFTRLKIGMGQKQVTDLIGPPTDQSSHVTGKAFIPFYAGAGRYETVLHYKGLGRLRFAGNGGFSTDTGLISIEHDASESGYP
jgi:hypothetical protein